MKNILVLIHDDPGQEARLQAALDLTRALRGHLTCLDVVQLAVPAGDYLGAAGAALMLEDSEAREAENRARLMQRLASEDVYQETLDVLESLYPDGQLRLFDSDVPGHDFWIYAVPE